MYNVSLQTRLLITPDTSCQQFALSPNVFSLEKSEIASWVFLSKLSTSLMLELVPVGMRPTGNVGVRASSLSCGSLMERVEYGKSESTSLSQVVVLGLGNSGMGIISWPPNIITKR